MPEALTYLALVLAIVALSSAASAHAKANMLSQKLDLLLRGLKIDLADQLALSERVKELARDPTQKIEAIKLYREETGVGLAEAKHAVELYIASVKQ